MADRMVRRCKRDSCQIALLSLANFTPVGNARTSVHISCPQRFGVNERVAGVKDADIEPIGSPA